MSFKRNHYAALAAGLVLLAITPMCGQKGRQADSKNIQIVNPTWGAIESKVTTTGSVEPQNRLEVKPPIGGRIEKILVREGQAVTQGETLAWLSSTERAALLDAARTQGTEAIQYWENAYKATPIISPITGSIIVRAVEPGQTVQASDPIVVVSDRLIVKAQVDETDIGKIKLRQKAVLSLDAYPDIRVEAVVDHIAYESKVVSNVTMYEVDILPKKVPPVFRSGMSANVDVIVQSKDHVLLLPREAVHQEKGRTFVRLSRGRGNPPEDRDVTIGFSNDQSTEIISGVSETDRVLITSPEYALNADSDKNTKKNPFLPSRRGARGGSGRSGGGQGH